VAPYELDRASAFPTSPSSTWGLAGRHGGCDRKPRFRCSAAIFARKFARSINPPRTGRERAPPGGLGPRTTGRESSPLASKSSPLLDEEGFRRRFPQSAVRRAKFVGFLRNVILALGNSRSRESAEILARLSRRDDVLKNEVLSTTLQRARSNAE